MGFVHCFGFWNVKWTFKRWLVEVLRIKSGIKKERRMLVVLFMYAEEYREVRLLDVEPWIQGVSWTVYMLSAKQVILIRR